MRVFKKTKWFEVFMEVERKRCLSVFCDWRREGNTYELWLGRCYFVLSID